MIKFLLICVWSLEIHKVMGMDFPDIDEKSNFSPSALHVSCDEKHSIMDCLFPELTEYMAVFLDDASYSMMQKTSRYFHGFFRGVSRSIYLEDLDKDYDSNQFHAIIKNRLLQNIETNCLDFSKLKSRYLEKVNDELIEYIAPTLKNMTRLRFINLESSHLMNIKPFVNFDEEVFFNFKLSQFLIYYNYIFYDYNQSEIDLDFSRANSIIIKRVLESMNKLKKVTMNPIFLYWDDYEIKRMTFCCHYFPDAIIIY